MRTELDFAGSHNLGLWEFRVITTDDYSNGIGFAIAPDQSGVETVLRELMDLISVEATPYVRGAPLVIVSFPAHDPDPSEVGDEPFVGLWRTKVFDGLYGRFQGDAVVAAETADLAIATAAASIERETAYGRPFEVRGAGIYGPKKSHLVVINLDED